MVMKMENKILVTFNFLELGLKFDAFIPVNELVWKIKKLVSKSVSDLVDIKEICDKNYIMINKDNSKVYSNNDIVIHTDIRNGTELIFIPVSIANQLL